MEAKIKVYGTPWCPDCKRAKQFLGEQRIPYLWIDVDQDPDGMRYIERVNNGKHIIPTILFQDGSILVEPTDAELAEKLGLRVKASRQFYDVTIVGSGPAGLSAAIYAAREGMEPLVIEQGGVGGQAATTQEIENYPGFPEAISGAVLAQRWQSQSTRFGVEVLRAQEVVGIDEVGDYRVLKTKSGQEYSASAVLVATGARYRRLGVPGEEDFIGAGVHFCATCDGPFYEGQEMLVVGGGNSGFQEGLFLTRFASKVTILEMMDRIPASAILQETAAQNPKIEVRTGATVQEFRGDTRLRSVVIKNVSTGETEEATPGAVFVFIGLEPNTHFLKGALELDGMGFIATNQSLETSIPGVYAAGDVRSGSTKQVASAVGEGATAALTIRYYLEQLGVQARRMAS